MKVKIQQVNKFQVTVDGVVHEGFEKISAWNGMLEFSGPAGTIIVNEKEKEKEKGKGFAGTFLSIFGDGPTSDEIEFDVVKASPDLIPLKGEVK